MRKGPPWSFVAWLAVCGVAMLFAPRPPESPGQTEDERTIMQRNADMLVRDAQRWSEEHGDRSLPWAEAQGHLAIVIDDVGRELHLFEKLVALRYRLTFSVLPQSIYAPGVQLRLRGDRRRYREIMLHLPMQPADPTKMREGHEHEETFLLHDDEPEVLRRKVAEALARVPAAVGVNNHMGSSLTRDDAAMAAVMAELATRELYFVDSRTIGDTHAEAAAAAAGIPTLRREVFLDHDPSAEAIDAALLQAAALSREHPVVAIAHPSVEVVAVLSRRLPELFAKGVVVYPVSRLVAQQEQARRRARSVGVLRPERAADRGDWAPAPISANP